MAAERTSVFDLSGNNEETILQWAKDLGRNKIRRRLFNAVYGRGSKPRSKKQLMVAAKISSAQAQQAQNQLDQLYSKHLIVRVDNDGSVRDGSLYLYNKDPAVRANRERIIKFADKPAAAARIATKRRPIVRGVTLSKPATRQSLRKKKHLNVLYLTADPDEKNRVRVDLEIRQVQDAVRRSPYRDNISLEYRPAADLKSLLDGLNDCRPRIVHFSGHGNSSGIAVQTRNLRGGGTMLSFELLGKALAATDAPPDVVVLNACDSRGAEHALLSKAKAVIVMRDSISDVAAVAFATQLYAAIASGQSLRNAFEQGRVAIAAVSINEADTPDLLLAPSINPGSLILA